MFDKNGMPIRIGIYAVIIKNNRVLMVHTKSGSKNCINFPGGGIEKGEGFIDTLKRECKEELGMDIKIEKFLYASKLLYIHEDFPHNYMYNLYFLANTDEVISAPVELQAEWIDIRRMPIDAMLPIDQECITTILS